MIRYARSVRWVARVVRSSASLLPLLPILLGLVFGAVIFALWRGLTSADSSVAPQIEFRKTNLHLGKLRTGVAKNCEFEFTNKGQAPIVIQSVNTSCVCTSVNWPKAPITAGQSGVIQVTLSSLGYRAPSELTAKLYVHCRSGESLRTELPIELRITASICDDVQISPPDIVIDDDGSAQPVQDLVIQRDLLDSESFAGLKLQLPSCLHASEKERSSNRIVFQLRLDPSRVVSDLNSVNLEYGKPIRRVAIPLMVNHIVRLTPVSFFVMVKRRHVSSLKETTCKKIEIVSTRYGKMKIASISGGDGLITSEIDDSRFLLWLKDLPENDLYASVLKVSYTCEYEGREIHGQRTLPVRVLIEP
jgi:hypothetical protein